MVSDQQNPPPPFQDYGPVRVYFGEKNGKYPDGNQVVVTGKDTKVAFDTPLSSHRLLPELETADLVILGHAHEDHAAGLGLLPDIPVMAPEQDLYAIASMEGMLEHYGYSPATREKMREKVRKDFHFVPRPDATSYENGQQWDLGGTTIRAVHMPGHTRGHSVLLVEPGGIAFIGDIDLSGFGPFYGDGCSDLREFRDTLQEIESLPANTWITFHHKGVIAEKQTFLELLASFREKIALREQAILQAIGKETRTLEELVAHRFLYPAGYEDIFVDDVERNTLLEHLSILIEEGRLQQTGEGYCMA